MVILAAVLSSLVLPKIFGFCEAAYTEIRDFFEQLDQVEA
jgi:hypothetical protein